MSRGPAVILDPAEVPEVRDLVLEVSNYPVMDNLLFALSFRGAMRVCEMAGLTRDAILGPRGRIMDEIRITVTKGNRGRVIEMHPEIRAAAEEFLWTFPHTEWFAMGRDGEQMRPATLGAHFKRLYDAIGFIGCTSHTGRATCITELLSQAGRCGGSIWDVKEFAGHKHLSSTAKYLRQSGALPDMVRSLGTNFINEGSISHAVVGNPQRRQRRSTQARTARDQQHQGWIARQLVRSRVQS